MPPLVCSLPGKGKIYAGTIQFSNGAHHAYQAIVACKSAVPFLEDRRDPNFIPLYRYPSLSHEKEHSAEDGDASRSEMFHHLWGTGDGPEALLPLKTRNAEAKSAVEKGRWVGLGFAHMGGGPMAGRSKTCLQCAV